MLFMNTCGLTRKSSIACSNVTSVWRELGIIFELLKFDFGLWLPLPVKVSMFSDFFVKPLMFV